jgi:hypothetical protein
VTATVDIHPVEQAGYFEVPGAHLYTVLHQVEEPWARVLLVGPFTSERHLSYISWVRWARYLAQRGIECLRYDYRGIGESTGVFEELSFEEWMEDVQLLAAWLKHRSPELPLVLHGLELGAILASKTFLTEVGDALLMWATPANANAAFRTSLLRRIAVDHAFKPMDERKPMSDYIQRMESGQFLNVDAYLWSGRLWHDSLKFEAPAEIPEGDSLLECKRPTRRVKLDGRAAPLVKGSSVGYEAVNRDHNWLFAENFDWISNALAVSRENQR